ncbi:hypothetical protein F2P81_009954 [Scophthalmus maximus]|uniref:Uncharacterized protein n=1 Tax=Scophthalmus maximus TaxID=52904 RepID=A0A6A4SZ31_SCOMX|nr:hypothetical protein F2P81_009954 [Scophthalmus maximus]
MRSDAHLRAQARGGGVKRRKKDRLLFCRGSFPASSSSSSSSCILAQSRSRRSLCRTVFVTCGRRTSGSLSGSSPVRSDPAGGGAARKGRVKGAAPSLLRRCRALCAAASPSQRSGCWSGERRAAAAPLVPT